MQLKYVVRIGEQNDAYVDFVIYEGSPDTGYTHDELFSGPFGEYQGSINWEGCMNWQTKGAAMAHLCGPQDADHLAEVMKAIWLEASKLMPKSDF